jgi:hypothetical protein
MWLKGCLKGRGFARKGTPARSRPLVVTILGSGFTLVGLILFVLEPLLVHRAHGTAAILELGKSNGQHFKDVIRPRQAMRVIQQTANSPKEPGFTRFVCLSDTHGLHGSPSVLKVRADTLRVLHRPHPLASPQSKSPRDTHVPTVLVSVQSLHCRLPFTATCRPLQAHTLRRFLRETCCCLRVMQASRRAHTCQRLTVSSPRCHTNTRSSRLETWTTGPSQPATPARDFQALTWSSWETQHRWSFLRWGGAQTAAAPRQPTS